MEIAFGVVIVLFCIFAVVARYGLLFPRLGRWIDARLYRVFPRLGHLFVEEENREVEEVPVNRN
jgi:hypothetical protein